jgi:hypothetical protein
MRKNTPSLNSKSSMRSKAMLPQMLKEEMADELEELKTEDRIPRPHRNLEILLSKEPLLGMATTHKALNRRNPTKPVGKKAGKSAKTSPQPSQQTR